MKLKMKQLSAFVLLSAVIICAAFIRPLQVSAAATDIVYITDYGDKYHNGYCSSLRKSKIPVTLQEAINRGKTACKLCHAHTLSVAAPAAPQAAGLTAEQIVQEAYKDYMAGGLDSASAFARVQAQVPALTALSPATAASVLAFVQADLAALKAPQAQAPAAQNPPAAASSVKTMADGGLFDPAFYAATYPDVVAAFGTDENLLYQHYLLAGKAEGRLPYAR